MILTALVLAQAAVSHGIADAEASSSVEQLDRTITVTGRSLAQTGEALEQCLARSCPPAEDIAASVAHAENQLIAGELQDARSTLSRARGRNKRYAETLPIPVSGLLYLDAEVASLLGLARYGRIGTIDSLSALKAGLDADDPRIALQRLRVGDVFLREGRNATAVKIYDAVAERAGEAGWHAIQGAAMFRALTFYAMAASVDPVYRSQARRRYAALRATTDEAMRPARDASIMLEVRLATLSDKSASIDAILADLGPMRTAQPMLAFAPPINLAATPHGSYVVTPTFSRDQWADFSYRITREGKVSDVEMTDKAVQADDRWFNTIADALARRRYLPLDIPADSPGLWRRERFMIVADLVDPRWSRIRVPAGTPKVRSIDLTSRVAADAGEATPQASAGAL